MPRGNQRTGVRNSVRQVADGTDSSSSSDSETVNPRRGRGAQNTVQAAPVGRYLFSNALLPFALKFEMHLSPYVGVLQISCSFGNNSI